MELIDLLSSVIIFLSQMTLFRCLTSLLGSLIVTVTVMLFWIFFYLLILVFVLQWLFLCWEILIMLVVSVSIDFSSNSKLFSCLLGWSSRRSFDRYNRRMDIFELEASVAATEFCEWLQGEIDVSNISLILNNRLILTHLHGFQLNFLNLK